MTLTSKRRVKFTKLALHTTESVDSNAVAFSQYHVYPDSMSEFVRELAPSLYMFSVDREHSTMVGYNVKPHVSAAIYVPSFTRKDL